MQPAEHRLAAVGRSDLDGIVLFRAIAGTEDGKETKLSAGSYLFQPAGQKHTSGCDAASECVGFLESSGKFGIKFVEEKKAPAKPAK